MNENTKRLARQVNSDAAEFRRAAQVALYTANISKKEFNRSINNVLRKASKLDDSSEKLAAAVLSS